MTLRRHITLPLLCAFLCVGLASSVTSTAFADVPEDPAHADPEPEVSDQGPYSRMLALALTGGVDTPFGLIGGVLEFAPIEYLNIYAGGGVGRSGVRIAGGAALRFPVDSTSFGFRLGVAGGPMDWSAGGGDGEPAQLNRYWEFALFAHAAFDIEYRFDEGIFVRGSLGAEALVAGDACISPQSGDDCVAPPEGLASPVRAWVGVTVGYAFEL